MVVSWEATRASRRTARPSPAGLARHHDPGEDHRPAPDLINRDFTATEPNSRWVGDITYIKTWKGWTYLATVIDLHSRKLVGWSLDTHMRTSLITNALTKAINARKPSDRVIFHSDRGTQYTPREFASYCEENNIDRSLGRTGICYDNAVAESFFASYKKKLNHTTPRPGRHSRPSTQRPSAGSRPTTTRDDDIPASAI